MENKGFLWHFMDMIYIENDVVTLYKYKHTHTNEQTARYEILVLRTTVSLSLFCVAPWIETNEENTKIYTILHRNVIFVLWWPPNRFLFMRTVLSASHLYV